LTAKKEQEGQKGLGVLFAPFCPSCSFFAVNLPQAVSALTSMNRPYAPPLHLPPRVVYKVGAPFGRKIAPITDRRRRLMARSILAIFAGFLITLALLALSAMLAAGLLAGTPLLAARLGLSAAVAALGGYATGAIAGRLPALHALVLAGLLFFLSLLAFAQSASQPQAAAQPRWYTLTLLLVTPLGVYAGGLLRLLSLKRQGRERQRTGADRGRA
jgi:hypothetical protein